MIDWLQECVLTSVEPVNATLSTSGWAASGAPQVSPKPLMTLMTPGGKPACIERAGKRC